MLAGIVIAALVVAGLVFGLPWLTAQRDDFPDPIDGDPEERFSESLRFVRTLAEAQEEEEDATEVTTPLTRQAELSGLRLRARRAAKRRRWVLLALLVAMVAVAVLTVLGIVPVWSLAIPGGLLVAFVVAARIGVWTLGRRYDACRLDHAFGFDDDEDTVTISLNPEESSRSIRVDLAPPAVTGALWEPIPVVAPTYVSKPLVPRTVRTIDLSAPVVASTPLVPTADRPGDEVADVDLELELEATQAMVHEFRPRAVGE